MKDYKILTEINNSLGTKKGRKIRVYWKEYSKVDDTNSCNFMYFVNRISK